MTGGIEEAASAFEDDLKQARLVEDEYWKVLEAFKEKDGATEAAEVFREALLALKEQHDGEEELQNKRYEIEAELITQQKRVEANVSLKDADEEAVAAALKREVQKAWEGVSESRKRELELRRSIQQLKKEIAQLTRSVENPEAMTLEEDAVVQELVSQRDAIAGEQEATLVAIQRCRVEEEDVQAKITRLEKERSDIVQEKNNIEAQRKEKVNEGRREEERRTRLERDLVDLKAQLEQQQAHLTDQQMENEGAEERVAAMEVRVREAQGAVEKLRKELQEKNSEADKLHSDIQEQTRRNTQYISENAKRELEIRQMEDESGRVREEIQKVQKIRETTLQMTTRAQRKKADLEKDYAALQSDVAALERDMELLVKEVDLIHKRQEGYIRERDVLNKLRTSKDTQSVKVADLIKVVENNKINLSHEIQGYHIEEQRQLKIMRDLDRERERLATEAEAAAAKHMHALEEVKVREVAIVDLQRRIVDVESRLKQQQNLYESVRSDRNLYSKNLVEAQDEIAEMKRRFKMMSHTITQLKDVIKQKNMEMVVYQLKKENIEKMKDQIKEKLDLVKKQISEADDVIVNQRRELEKLNRIINEADQELARQQKEYDIVINERDILGQQLIKRNQELAKVYERIKVQQSLLASGQVHYRERVRESTALQSRITMLRAELEALKTSVSDIGGLRNETHKLRRELLREQIKVKALQEELMVPMNVHRWRKLEGSDPETFERIQLIQSLQRKLIGKTEEVLEKDLLIQEKEKLYLELKSILARQPGPEVVEQLEVYRKTLKDKTGQLRQMEKDLKTHQAKVLEHKYEIERLVQGLGQLKDQWFAIKRRERRAQRGRGSSAEEGTAPEDASIAADGVSAVVGALSERENARTDVRPGSKDGAWDEYAAPSGEPSFGVERWEAEGRSGAGDGGEEMGGEEGEGGAGREGQMEEEHGDVGEAGEEAEGDEEVGRMEAIAEEGDN